MATAACRHSHYRGPCERVMGECTVVSDRALGLHRTDTSRSATKVAGKGVREPMLRITAQGRQAGHSAADKVDSVVFLHLS